MKPDFAAAEIGAELSTTGPNPPSLYVAAGFQHLAVCQVKVLVAFRAAENLASSRELWRGGAAGYSRTLWSMTSGSTGLL